MPRGPSHVTRTLSGISRKIARTSGVNAKVSIQKIFASWEDIIGKDFADKCIPVHISWSKHTSKKKSSFLSNMPPAITANKPLEAAPAKGKKTKKETTKPQKTSKATLHIAASSAIATRLMYQEHLILERLARVLGQDVIEHIVTKHESGLDNRSYGFALPKKLGKVDKEYLSDSLDFIEDETLKTLLKSLGEKILLDKAP